MSSEFCVECYTYGTISSGMILIEGPPAVGKTSLLKAFARLALQNERTVVYVSTQSPAMEISADLTRLSGLQLAPESVRVLDCFTPLGALSSGEKSFSPGNLSEISIELQSTLGKLKETYVVFDSIDPFALDATEDSALKFFRNVAARVKSKNSTGAATLTTGVHSTRFQTALRTIFQGTIELNLEEKEGKLERHLRIRALKGAAHLTDWFPFSITEEGVVIGTEQYRQTLPPRHQAPHFLRFTR